MQSRQWPPPYPPPSYDGSLEAGAFDDYKIKAKLWLKRSSLNDDLKGARLLQGLTGRAFEKMKHLAEDETWMDAENGGQQLIALMSSNWIFGKLRNEDLAQELQDLCDDRMKDKDDDTESLRSKFDEQGRKHMKVKLQPTAKVRPWGTWAEGRTESIERPNLGPRKRRADPNEAASDDPLQKVMTTSNDRPEPEVLEYYTSLIHVQSIRTRMLEMAGINQTLWMKNSASGSSTTVISADKITTEKGEFKGRLVAKEVSMSSIQSKGARNRRHPYLEKSETDDTDEWTETQIADPVADE